MNIIKPLLLSGISVSLAISIGRIFGFLRDMLIAYVFGKSYAADMATLSLMVPDTIANFLFGGAFSSAFMPALLNSSERKKIKLVYNFHILMGIFFAFFCFLIYLYAGQISFFIAEKMPLNEKLKLADLISLSCWSIPFIVFSCILTSYLNSKHLFFFPALGASVINICICVSLVVSPMLKLDALYMVALSIFLGGLLRWMFQFYPLFRMKSIIAAFQGISISLDVIEKKYIKKYLHAFFSTSAMVLLPILSRYFMLQTGDGQLSNFSYAQKLADLFITLVSGSIITVLIPRIIRSKDKIKYMIFSLFIVLLCSSIISIVLNLYSEFISTVLFGRGAFNHTAIVSLSKHIELMSYVIPFYASVFFLTGSLAVTDLSFKNTLSTLFGLISFVVYISIIYGQDINYKLIYYGLIIGYFTILFNQALFIFYHERHTYAKINVYHKQP